MSVMASTDEAADSLADSASNLLTQYLLDSCNPLSLSRRRILQTTSALYLLVAGLLPFPLVLLVELLRRHDLATLFAHHFGPVGFQLKTTALAGKAH